MRTLSVPGPPPAGTRVGSTGPRLSSAHTGSLGTGAAGGQVPRLPASPAWPPADPATLPVPADPQAPAEPGVPALGGRRSSLSPANPNILHLQQHQNTNQATEVTKNTALFVFKHDIHGGFTVCMLQHALFLAPCLLKLGPLFSTVYQDQYV